MDLQAALYWNDESSDGSADVDLGVVNRQDFSTMQLWVLWAAFQVLDAARKLYESHGFTLMHEVLGTQWDNSVMEQQFTRLPVAA